MGCVLSSVKIKASWSEESFPGIFYLKRCCTKINLWGGAVQKYRGYIVRNYPGPYSLPGGNIGYNGKDYNFDCNLKCSFPPLYPENTTCDESADELPWSVTAYY